VNSFRLKLPKATQGMQCLNRYTLNLRPEPKDGTFLRRLWSLQHKVVAQKFSQMVCS
jgi:hypothetical protein